MEKNNIIEVLKLLDVELNERFKLRINSCTDGNIYFFGVNGLMCERNGIAYREKDSVFVNIILGNYVIEKLPWKPKVGDKYYAIASTDNTKPYISLYIWRGFVVDYTLWKLEMIYRTEEEARAHMSEDYKKLTGRKLENDA